VIQLELEAALEAKLAAEAEAKGLRLDRYIETIVATRPVEQLSKDTVSKAVDTIFELRKGNKLGGLSIKELIHDGHRY
jgi:hypothetical protein